MRWFERSTPDNFPSVPWLDPMAISALEAWLAPDMEVLEHGAGGSTLWMAQRVKKVASVESDIDFYAALTKRVPANVTLLYRTDVSKLHPADLLLIDGEPVEDRREWILAAPQLAKKYVVLDNANRPEYNEERKTLLKEFELMMTIKAKVGEFLLTEFYARR